MAWGYFSLDFPVVNVGYVIIFSKRSSKCVLPLSIFPHSGAIPLPPVHCPAVRLCPEELAPRSPSGSRWRFLKQDTTQLFFSLQFLKVDME